MKEVVCVPLEWTKESHHTEVLLFHCPKCEAITKRKKVQNVVLTITCKNCKQKFILEYGEISEVYNDYADKKVIIHFPEIKK